MSNARRLLLFDLDGTLVDSAPDIADAVDQALEAHGRPGVGEDVVRGYIGNGAERLVHRALTGSRDGDAAAAEFAAVYASFLEIYQANLYVRTRVYPGVGAALRALADDGWTLGVVTNKPTRFTMPLLAAAELDDWFAIVLSGDSLPRKKPDPLPLIHAADAVGADLAQTIMVGDSIADLEAARQAGVPAICVSYGYAGGVDLVACGVDRLIDEMSALPAAVSELRALRRFGGQRAALP